MAAEMTAETVTAREARLLHLIRDRDDARHALNEARAGNHTTALHAALVIEARNRLFRLEAAVLTATMAETEEPA